MYFAKDSLWKFELEVKNKLDHFNEYMPSHKVVKTDELKQMIGSIASEIKERFEEHLVPLDQDFS